MWDCLSIHFQDSENEEQKSVKWCYSIQYTGKQCCMYCTAVSITLTSTCSSELFVSFRVFLKRHHIKLFHSDLVSLETASQYGQTDSLNVVEYGVVLDEAAFEFLVIWFHYFPKPSLQWQLPVSWWTFGPSSTMVASVSPLEKQKDQNLGLGQCSLKISPPQ